jgi:hypothetical protein
MEAMRNIRLREESLDVSRDVAAIKRSSSTCSEYEIIDGFYCAFTVDLIGEPAATRKPTSLSLLHAMRD